MTQNETITHSSIEREHLVPGKTNKIDMQEVNATAMIPTYLPNFTL